MSGLSSAIYVGEVCHARLRPRRHRLRYRLYSLLIDLDEIDQLDGRLRFFSHNRFNLFSLRDRDFGEASGGSIRDEVDGRLRAAGLPTGGRILLMAMPRVLGYAFNPISVFFCHAPDGALAALLYEVHNTFGERHCYLIPAGAERGSDERQTCAKDFHVSPFLDMGMSYRFRVAAPGADYRITITGADADGPLIVAKQMARRVELTDRALARVFVTHPLVTLKVIGAIHFEALRLWMKGVKARSKPPAPSRFVSPGSPVLPNRG